MDENGWFIATVKLECFNGVYFAEPGECDSAERTRARTEFKRLFDKKAYAEARALLEPVLESCAARMSLVEQFWFRNDLAPTLARLGIKKACLDMLRPMIEDTAKSDVELMQKYGNPTFEPFVRLRKATLANLNACRRAGEARPKPAP